MELNTGFSGNTRFVIVARCYRPVAELLGRRKITLFDDAIEKGKF
jgi:hypothetical protein